MNTDNLSYFSIASKRLEWLAARQKAVSQNIANADTPGVRAKDVMPFDDFLSASRNRAAQVGSDALTRQTDDSWMMAPNGNNISLEQQTILSTETAQDHGLASRLYSKAHQMLILASSSGR